MKLNNDMMHEMYTRTNQIREGKDPQYAINPRSRTPIADIMSSRAMDDITSKYDKKFEQLNAGFQKQLGMSAQQNQGGKQ
jgi:heterodisulfide reductase subunit B